MCTAAGLTPGMLQVSYKISRCHQELQDWRSAVAELEAVPSSFRGPSTSANLGSLYQRLGHNKLAIASYKVRSTSANTPLPAYSARTPAAARPLSAGCVTAASSGQRCRQTVFLIVKLSLAAELRRRGSRQQRGACLAESSSS